jgi:hypothetical protein
MIKRRVVVFSIHNGQRNKGRSFGRDNRSKLWFRSTFSSQLSLDLHLRTEIVCSRFTRGARGVRKVGRSGGTGGLLCGFANIAVRLPVGLLAAAVAVEGCFAAGAAAFGWAAGARRAS